MDIWQQCAGERQVRPLRGKLLRMVESQAQVATSQLVDNLAEQALLEDLLAIDAVARRYGNAHAGRCIRLLPVDHHRTAKAALQPVGERGKIFVGGQIAEQNGKFIAAKPRDDRLAQHALQMGGDVAKQCIPRRVAQRVVDLFELVEV